MVACRPPFETIVLLPAPTRPRQSLRPRSTGHAQSKPKTAAGATAAPPKAVPARVACFATCDLIDVDPPSQHSPRVLRRLIEFTQYSSEQFQTLLADHGVTCSMSRSGNVWDNAAMESFFSSLKTERTARKVYRTRDQARADVFDYIERFYNPRRRHSTIGYLSPMEFERIRASA
jgi:putative transposase